MLSDALLYIILATGIASGVILNRNISIGNRFTKSLDYAILISIINLIFFMACLASAQLWRISSKKEAISFTYSTILYATLPALLGILIARPLVYNSTKREIYVNTHTKKVIRKGAIKEQTREIIVPIIVFISGLLLGNLVKLIRFKVEEIAILWLYVLIGIVGVSVGISSKRIIDSAKKGIKNGLILAFSVIAGDLIAGILLSEILKQNYTYSLVISLGSGWYSLVGPLLSLYSPYYGTIAFISNLLRESLTFMLFPLIFNIFDIPSIAFGGATTMDTTLGIIIKYSGVESGTEALTQGLIITLLLPVILPIIISF
ncbi:MAG: lysine exporter LysO family protein [Caldisphaeraceae archaeon]|nr:lysine exporter LysO family protein [Caldisphaeraceae archaeon]MEB3691642.1 lysine exporter LysO family protein [Caldisphaeraceae archaeon]MEB3798031.1 lysine exporter LysO family protein [Caldisphaeraceae archaeon]